MSESEDSYSCDDEQWKPEYNALKDILNSQKTQLKKIKKTNAKETSPAAKKDIVRTVNIKGRNYQAIIGGNGTIRYFDNGKLKTVRDKTLYQQFLREDPQPGNGYARYKTTAKAPTTTSAGSFKVPVSNTQTFRQLIATTIVKEAWEECKTILPPDRQFILHVYNAVLKDFIDNIVRESGLQNSASNAEALHEYVSQQLKNRRWCTKKKEEFKKRLSEYKDPN